MGNHYNCLSIFFCCHLKQGDYLITGLGIKISCRLIARAIAAQPPVILADEPTGNLDSASSKEILQILKSMHEQGKTVILITHDNGIAAQARRVVRIIDGKIESDFINKDYGKEEYIKNQLDA